MVILAFIVGCGIGFFITKVNYDCHFFYKCDTGLPVRIKGKYYLINRGTHDC